MEKEDILLCRYFVSVRNGKEQLEILCQWSDNIPRPPFSPLTPSPHFRTIPDRVPKKRAPRAAPIVHVPVLQRSGRITRFKGSYIV